MTSEINNIPITVRRWISYTFLILSVLLTITFVRFLEVKTERNAARQAHKECQNQCSYLYQALREYAPTSFRDSVQYKPSSNIKDSLAKEKP